MGDFFTHLDDKPSRLDLESEREIFVIFFFFFIIVSENHKTVVVKSMVLFTKASLFFKFPFLSLSCFHKCQI